MLEGALTVQQGDKITAAGPGEFAGYFEELAEVLPAEGMPDEEDEKRIAALDAKYGLETNPAAIPELIEQHGLNDSF